MGEPPDTKNFLMYPAIFIEAFLLYGCLLVFWRFLDQHSLASVEGKPLNKRATRRRASSLSLSRKAKIALSLLFILCWTPILLASWPGYFCYDVESDYLAEWSQFESGQLNSHHPILHTLLLGTIVNIGRNLRDFNTGIALFTILQALFIAGVFTYMISWLKRSGGKGFLLGFSVAYAEDLADVARSSLLEVKTIDIIKIWFAVGIRHPGEYIHAFLLQTQATWNPYEYMTTYTSHNPDRPAETSLFTCTTEPPGTPDSKFESLGHFLWNISNMLVLQEIPFLSFLVSLLIYLWLFLVVLAHSIITSDRARVGSMVFLTLLILSVLVGPCALILSLSFLWPASASVLPDIGKAASSYTEGRNGNLSFW